MAIDPSAHEDAAEETNPRMESIWRSAARILSVAIGTVGEEKSVSVSCKKQKPPLSPGALILFIFFVDRIGAGAFLPMHTLHHGTNPARVLEAPRSGSRMLISL